MSETYKPESPVPSGKPVTPYAQQAHEHSAVPYIVVWLILCGLTLLTVLTGKQHLGAIALPLALTIASVKSLLVLLFFMHLWETKGAPRLIIGLSVCFALLLMFFTMADVTNRFVPLTPAGAPFGAKVHLPSDDEKGASRERYPKMPRVSP